MNNKKGFLIYHNQYVLVNQLNDDQAGKLFKAIFEYEINDRELELDPMTKIVFLSIQQTLDIARDKYNNVCERNKKNINKRWNTKNTTGKTGIPKNTKNTDIDIDKDIDIDIDIDKDINTTKSSCRYAEFQWQRLLNGTEIRSFNDFDELYGYERVKEAIDISCMQNKTTCAYVKGILTKQPRKPNWLDKEFKKEELTSKDKKELEELLEGFK